MKRAVFLLGLAGLAGCKDEDPSSIEIPSQVHGMFGRNADDLYHGTRGLEVDGASIRFSEMTMVVTAGKMVGDTFQIDRAEVRWKKDDPEKLPKECKGTLARQGERLLVTLFKMDSDEACESILKGEWSQWKKVTQLPESMHGTYGGADPYDPEPGIRIEGKHVVSLVEGEGKVELVEGFVFTGKEDEVFVTEAKYEDTTCRGAIRLDNKELSVALDTPPEVEGFCPLYGGQRWEVGKGKVPTGTLTNGKVTATFDGNSVTLTNQDSAAFTCKQDIVRTSTRSTTDKSRDNLTVLSGQVLTLAQVGPTSGSHSCQKRMTNLLMQECRQYGGECDEASFSDVEVHCPTHLVVGDPSGPGRKVALLPNEVKMLACYDVTGNFTEK